jgi:hypothetical protein
MMHGNARYVVLVDVIQTLRCCDDRGSVLVGAAAAIAGHPRAMDTCQ